MKKKNVMIIGNGGREHAIADKISFSSNVNEIFVFPGNGGTEIYFKNAILKGKDFRLDLLNFIKKNNIEFVVIGPEQYLVDGIIDFLEENNIKNFGPNSYCANLEGSKVFAKEVMKKSNVPTADFKVFTDYEKAKQFIENSNEDYVLKADGLCAGKGVIIPKNKGEAIAALKEFFIDKKFGKAGEKVLLEKKIFGEEASILAFCDGENIRLLPPSQDHKRIGEGDTGLNTGGMGAYSPLPFLNDEHLEFIEKNIFKPVILEMKQRGHKYKGILYAGLMVNKGEINVIEFNVRFGDPECQCVLPLLDSDLLEVMIACYEGNLDKVNFSIKKLSACTVVLASGGYPQSYEVGKSITGLEKFRDNELIYHAGTQKKDEKILTSGGRVLSITSLSQNLENSIKNIYGKIENIKFEGCYFRRDIGKKILDNYFSKK